MRPPNWVTQKGKVLRVGNGCAIKVAGNMQIKHKLFSHRPTHTHQHTDRDLQMQTAHTYTKMTALQLHTYAHMNTHVDECIDETVHAHT